jgi:hypothetical protein
MLKSLVEEEEVVRDEEQKLEQWHVFGQSLAQRWQQLVVLLSTTPCAAASGAQETDQQRLFCPLDPWASSAAVEKMSRPQKHFNAKELTCSSGRTRGSTRSRSGRRGFCESLRRNGKQAFN